MVMEREGAAVGGVALPRVVPAPTGPRQSTGPLENEAPCGKSNTMAKQNARQMTIRSGLKGLRNEGLETESPDATMVEPLLQRFGADPAASLAVVYVLGRIRDAAAVEALKSLEGRPGSKEIRREVRRSLFKLAQGGLGSAEPEAPQAEEGGANFSLAPEINGYLSSVTGGGSRMVMLTRPQPGGGLMVMQAAVNDRRGLERLGGNVIRRKELRQMMDDMKGALGVSMTPVPWEYADWLVHEAYQKVTESPGEGVGDYPRLRTHLTAARPAQRSHPIFDLVDADGIDSTTLSETSEKLLDEPELRTWFVEKDLLEPYLERLEETERSRIVLNAMQKEERFRNIVREAVQGIFLGAETAPAFEQRFEDAALHLHVSGQEEKARTVLGVALAIRRGDLGSLGVPLLEGLVMRSISLHKTQEKEEAAAESSLIVKP